jgi:ABC-type Mn2+/Zn2+ transport system ATPase subunit
MDIIDNKSEKELLQSIIAEIAKANNEILCAQKDLKKAQSRLNFLIVVSNKLIERQEIDR